METTFSIRLIASDHLFYDGPCTGVIIPALDGQREVLAHHESVIMAIDCGELKIKMPDGTWQIAIVGSGFARVSHGRVYVLVDTAERPEEIDVKRAQEAKERAEEQLRQKQSIQEYHISSASLALAMSRLSASGKSGNINL
ncbi:MAG: ATP synthase F1 subunit epsilon [[Clostridium] nexile]